MEEPKKKPRLIRLLSAVILTVFFAVLPVTAAALASSSDNVVFTYELEANNSFKMKVKQRKGSTSDTYRYHTHSWVIFQTRQYDAWEDGSMNSYMWSDGITIMTASDPESSTTPDAAGIYTDTYVVPADTMVNGMKNAGWCTRADMINGSVTVYASRIMQIKKNNVLQSTEYYNWPDFADAVKPGQWSAGAERAIKDGQDKEIRVEFNTTGFSVSVLDTNGTPLSNPYDNTLGGKVIYGETIGKGTEEGEIDYPGEIAGYSYVGYKFNDTLGTQSSSKYVEAYTIKKENFVDKVELIFLYEEIVPPPPPEEQVSETIVYFDTAGGTKCDPRTYYGGTYNPLPTTQREDYVFVEWRYYDGYEYEGIVNPSAGESAVTNASALKTEDTHVLVAVWKEIPIPIIIPGNEVTYRERYYYFTTDKGYTLDAIANTETGYHLAGVTGNAAAGSLSADYNNGGLFKRNEATKRESSYRIGTDSKGNTWYFRYSTGTTNATYVHPAVYNGYDANTAQVQYITELTFPSTITYNGTSYTVTSIGGGGATFHSTDSGDGYDYDPEYGYYKESDDYFSDNLSYSSSSRIEYRYGVLGNGHITSTADVWQEKTDSYCNEQSGAANYYVYNTTLKKVTIPAGATILKNAFLYCQALESVTCNTVTTFSENSFATATILAAQLSENSTTEVDGFTIRKDINRYYNESYSTAALTAVMTAWEQTSALFPVNTAMSITLNNAVTIKSNAFFNRWNMYDISIGSKVTKIEKDAFAKCKLDSVTIGAGSGLVIESTTVTATTRNTLGTKGMVDTPTVIIATNAAASNVINYGIYWSGYYDLKAGYTITYKPNGGFNPKTGGTEDIIDYTNIFSDSPVFVKQSGDKWLDSSGGVWLLENFTDGRKPYFSASSSFTAGEDTVTFSTGTQPASTGMPREKIVLYSASKTPSDSGDLGGETLTRDYYAEPNADGTWTIKYDYLSIVTSPVVGSNGQIQGYKPVSQTGGTEVVTTPEPIIDVKLLRSKYNDGYFRFGRLVLLRGSSGGVYVMSGKATESYDSIKGATITTVTMHAFTKLTVTNSSGIKQIEVVKELVNDTYQKMFYLDVAGAVYMGNLHNFAPAGSTSTKIGSGPYRDIIGGASNEGIVIRNSSGYIYTVSVNGTSTVFTRGGQNTEDLLEVASDGKGMVYALTASGKLIYASVSDKTSGVIDSTVFTDIELLAGVLTAYGQDGYLYVMGDADAVLLYGYTSRLTAPEKADHLPLLPHDKATVTATGEVNTAPFRSIGLLIKDGEPYDTATGRQAGTAGRYYFAAVIKETSVFVREGYRFYAWNVWQGGTGVVFKPGETVKRTSNLTLYAAPWVAVKNIVRYHRNHPGATGTMADTVLKYDVHEATLRECTFTNDGFQFAGWAETPDGPVVYGDMEYVTGIRGIKNLYAKWEPIPYMSRSYTLIYMKYPYGTEANSEWKRLVLDYNDETEIEGAPYTTSACTVTYDLNWDPARSTTPAELSLTAANTNTQAASFDKWERYDLTDSGQIFCGKTYEPGKKVSRLTKTNGATIYLYPLWNAANASVVLPNTTAEGYDLLGWSETPAGSGIIYTVNTDGDEGGIYTAVQNTKLYAQWKPWEKKIALSALCEGAAPETHEQKDVTFTFDKVPPKVIVPTSDRYVFQGYYTALNASGAPASGSIQVYDKNGEAAVQDNGKIIVSNNVNGIFDDIDTLYAYWAPDKAIEYRPNYSPLDDDCPSMDIDWIADGATTVKLSKNLFTRKGWVFTGWNTYPGGTGTPYADEATITAPNGKLILYAQWVRIEYDVEYDLYGNKPDSSTTPAHATPIPTTKPKYNISFEVHNPSMQGYIFQGWNITGMDDSTHTIGGVATNATSMTLCKKYGYKNLRQTPGTVKFEAQWEETEYEITLDVRGATSKGISEDSVNGHTEQVTMKFDAECPAVTTPSKTGYTFVGYYTGIAGEGTQYYDETGTGVLPWTEDNVKVLYACWRQNEIELPEEEDYIEPEEEEEITIERTIGRTDAKGLLYADDYDDTTGALTDLQPYLTYDTLATSGVIPGTEFLAFRAKLGSFMLNYKFRKQTGIDDIRIIVTVPYRTQYEVSETEELVISERKTAEYSFTVPKSWSYWEVVESGLYYPDYVVVKNHIFPDGEIVVKVNLDDTATVKVPEYDVIHYGERSEHIRWQSYDADGIPVYRMELTGEQYIISDTPDTPPDVDAYNKIVAKNAAWKNDCEAEVRSDLFKFNGKTILSDEWQKQQGASLEEDNIPKNADEVELTSYLQTYAAGITMDELKPNGLYETYAEIVYVGDASNIGTDEVKTVELEDINDITVHTPVICDGVLSDGIEYRTEEDGTQVAVLTLKDALNFFDLRVENTGVHLMSLGYGYRDFAKAFSGKSNVALNQVQFSFDVYVDVGNDGHDVTDDYLLPAGKWITTGVETRRFYLPVTAENGRYTVNFRSIAVNCPKEEDGRYPAEGFQENYANLNPNCYVATDALELEVESYIKGFRIVSVDEPGVAAVLGKDGQIPTLKKGYGFHYQLLTQGQFFGENVELHTVPKYYLKSEDGICREVVLYRMKQLITEEKRRCYAWDTEPFLLQQNNYDVILQEFSGRGMIPSDVWCVLAEKQEAFEEYAKNHTLTGKEEFFVDTGYLYIAFDIRIKSNQNKWYRYETGEVIRYDLSRSVKDDYEVGGRE